MENPIHLLRFSGSNKLPVVLQTEAAECGLASVAMVANYYGHRVDLNTLRRDYPISLKGATLQSLMLTADRLHFATRALRLELDEMNQLQCPAILHWDLNHFVVLKKVVSHAIIIHDPAVGERKNEEKKVRLSDLWQQITGLRLPFTH